MKSVIQEGSTVAKAIEQGWIKAGKPKEFTIKIFQEPQKNFFGITTIIAKVGIFFRDSSINEEHAPKEYQEKRFTPQNQQNSRPRQQQSYQQRRNYKKRNFHDNRDNRNAERSEDRRRYPQRTNPNQQRNNRPTQPQQQPLDEKKDDFKKE